MAKYYKKSRIQYVQSHWGKDFSDIRKEELSFRDTENHFVSMMKRADWILDDQTWNDLEMNEVYCKMDRAYSKPGAQVLYNELRTPVFDEKELKRRDRVMDYILHHQEQRDKLGCIFYSLGRSEYDGACSLLFKGIPKLPEYASWTNTLAILMLISLISIPFFKLSGLMFAVIMFVVNPFYHQKLNRRTEAAMPGVRYIASMIDAAEEIANLQIPQLEADYGDFFQKCAKKCAPLRKKAGVFGGGGGGDLAGLLEYIQILFLVEDRAYIRCTNLLEEYAPVLRVLYRKLGELDALMAVASFRRGLRRSAKPVFVEEPQVLRVENIIHPLLEREGVANSLTVEQKNVVITGSNMSGKSTFLRTIATGALMAQTFYTVCADSYEASFFNIVTSISPSDDLMGGKSYYMAEAEALLRMLRVVEEKRTSLLIVDEIFRGTNPIERVAAASSLLRYLGERNTLVIVATHDIEITNKVADQYDSYHFGENVTKEKLDFDYTLKRGVLKAPNGIRILEYLGYPEEITEEAYKETGYVGAQPALESEAVPDEGSGEENVTEAGPMAAEEKEDGENAG